MEPTINRRTILLGTAALVPALSATSSDAPMTPSGSSYVLPRTERFVLRSQHVSDSFRIEICLPKKTPPGDLYRVLYVLDAYPNFAPISVMARELAESDIVGVERLIVVGIGYPDDEDGEIGRKLRLRDFTMPGFSTRVFRHLGKGEIGGAEQFLRFIQEELDPLVRQRYPCLPGRAGLFGASLGGNFVLYALFRRAPLFDRYAASSPGILDMADSIWSLEEECFRSGSELPAKLYLTLGALEETMPTFYQSYAQSYRTLVNRLVGRNYREFDFAHEVFPNETHLTSIWMTMSRGIRHLYGKVPESTP